ncbi:odorant receptor 22c isoform X2 [Solenopsis invicta]|uniref:odorant receptor 22c isoform X2 n=1 Tax=Solenopsis invicta TaxID=13686 RepID=UPI00193D2EE1|nr:odorant receptor 22c isoform X2 [Solenopsis invicta]
MSRILFGLCVIIKTHTNIDLTMKEARNWNDESRYALNVYKKVLNIIGVWPLNAEEFTSVARCSLAILIQISTIVSLSLEAYWQCLGPEDMMEAFLMDLSSVVSLSKLLVIRLSWRHTYVLVTSIIDDWSISRDTQRREIMMRYTHAGRAVSLTMLYLGYASGFSFIFMAIPFDSFIPWLNVSEVNNNDTMVTPYFLATYCVFGSLRTIAYTCVLLLQVAQIFVNATSHCGNDGFFFGLAMHLCGQFEVLQMDFAGIKAEEQTCKKEIKMLISRHCDLIRLADSFEYAFNMAIFAQVSMSVLLLCVEGMQLIISLKLNDNIAAIKHIVLILTMLVQLYLYCYAGDQLEYVTGRIGYSLYDSPWYNFDLKAMKNLPMVMHRGRMPHQTTAGRFLRMNLFSFKEILKATGSYLSVLRVMIDV